MESEGGDDLQNTLTTRLRQGDPAALEEAMDRYAAYAAKIIAAFLRDTMPREDHLKTVACAVFYGTEIPLS